MRPFKPLHWLTAALCAVLVASIQPLYAAQATIKIGRDHRMAAELLTPDDSAKHPGILLLHTSRGLDAADLQFAKRLVDQGYVVLVPHFMEAYGITAKTRRDTFTTYADPIYADFVAGLAALRDDPHVDGGRLGAIGFSNGGYFALWLAATNQVSAGVAYYGALTGAGTDKSLDRFRGVFTKTSAPVLVMHGEDDQTVPFAKAEELDGLLTAAQAPHEFHAYEDAGHGFERTPGGGNEAAAADAWQRTVRFFGQYLKR